ncbi:hypothetical protein BOX15_Mlig002307g1 [Macrostomum lignano]|uniref:Uncharacterized protein n=1 Tax=Macrostomum lignano TaxID=282301 RepID=A0A267FHP5_9PLAT|nr:hypothetical protein BOX15_Mlig002307g1 [Macrostomum lignano]
MFLVFSASNLSLLLLTAALLLKSQSMGMPASAENSDDDLDDLLPDPAGDVEGGSGGDTGGSAEVDAEEPVIPDPTMTPENLNDLKDIWSNPDIPEVKFERPKPKYSPDEQLRNTMGGRGFRRPRVRFGDYYIQG